MEAFYKSSGLSATIPAARYSEQSTRRILSGIPSASDRGVYSLLFCSIFTLRESPMIPSTNSTLPFQLVTGLSAVSVLQMTCRSDGDSDNERQDLTHPLVPSASAYSMGVNIERSKYQ